jgi:DNA processing protein
MDLFSSKKNTRQSNVSEQEKLDWLQLIRTENIGPITFHNFIDYYGSADAALKALPQLAAKSKRKKPLKAAPRKDIEREYEALKKRGGDIVIATEDVYPLALGALEDAPPVLSYIGDVALFNKPTLGVVGSRNASHNGRKFTQSLATELGTQNQVIASGLARGIDTAAHIGALESGTIAVVAGGVDIIYPPENTKLYEEICEKGLVVAESPLGMPPRARDFPRRNRIVSGLSQGVIVVEANMRSGSLITARLAAEQGRDVYAVPGHPMDPRAEGPNHLIREGAQLIRHADDIMEHVRDFSGTTLRDSALQKFDHLPMQDISHEQDTGDIKELLRDNLSHTPTKIDELVREFTLPVSAVQQALIEMELDGEIERLPGNRVSLICD